jgi:hypothetical protein
MIPRARCPRAEFGDLTADVKSTPWNRLDPLFLADALMGAAPRQGTAVRIAWDLREWRILFHAADTDAWATLTARDASLYEEETVEVFFDPVGNLESYFEIEVNPLGAVLDLVLRKSRSGYKADRAWDCVGLRTLVRKDAGIWSAELAIPFTSVTDMAPEPGVTWRVNFCRIDRPSRDGSLPRELTAWSPPGRANFHTPERFGVIEFSERQP